jgi:hypothetical protein
MLDEALPATSKWLATSDPGLRLHCRTPEKGVLVVILIDVPAVLKATSSHLTRWIETPLTPLREAGERVLIESLAAGPLATIGPENAHHHSRRNPASRVQPQWQ